MTDLRTLLDGTRPAIAVSYTDTDAAASAWQAAALGVDVAELRIDRFADTSAEHVTTVARAFADLATVGTIRSAAEGGAWPGDEEQRLALFRTVIPLVDCVDVEISADAIRADVVDEAHRQGTAVILSHHDFHATPDLGTLHRIVDTAAGAGADFIKVSTMATSVEDVRRLAALTLQAGENALITIAMGTAGVASRIFFPALGSRLTYSYLEGASAPGQLPFEETYALLQRFYPV